MQCVPKKKSTKGYSNFVGQKNDMMRGIDPRAFTLWVHGVVISWMGYIDLPAGYTLARVGGTVLYFFRVRVWTRFLLKEKNNYIEIGYKDGTNPIHTHWTRLHGNICATWKPAQGPCRRQPYCTCPTIIPIGHRAGVVIAIAGYHFPIMHPSLHLSLVITIFVNSGKAAASYILKCPGFLTISISQFLSFYLVINDAY